jgi:hypothetical protein
MFKRLPGKTINSKVTCQMVMAIEYNVIIVQKKDRKLQPFDHLQAVGEMTFTNLAIPTSQSSITDFQMYLASFFANHESILTSHHFKKCVNAR